MVHTQDWVTFGQNEELEELTSIKGLSIARSRALYEAGYVNAKLVTYARPYNLYKALQSAISWGELGEKEQLLPMPLDEIENIQVEAREIYLRKARIYKKKKCKNNENNIPN